MKFRTFFKYLAVLLVAACFFTEMPRINSAAATGSFSYKDLVTKTTTEYKGTIPMYLLDGSRVDIADMPALIMDNNAMAPMELFTDNSSMEITYKSSKKRLTITYLGQKLILYVGSKEGTFNGEPVNAPVAPLRIKYSSSGKTTCLIPSRFVAETFGFYYDWSSDKGTATMLSSVDLLVDGRTKLYAGTKGKLFVDDEEVNVKATPSYIFNDNAMICLKKVASAIDGFDYDYDSESGELSLSYGEITIDMEIGSRDSYINGIYTKCPEAPHRITNNETHQTKVYIPGRFVFENLGFDYKWVTDTSFITTIDTTGVYDPDFDLALHFDPEQADDEDDGDADIDVKTSGRSEYRQVIRIPLLEGIRTDLIGITDRLWEDIVTFDLQGNYIQFFIDNPIRNTGEAIIQAQVLYYEDADITRIKLYTRRTDDNIILAHKDLSTDAGIVFIFDKPANLFDKIIVLDAGHGGTDPGTQHGGYNEKDLNFLVVYTYCKAQFDKSNIKVFYSRYDDTLIPLHDRPKLPAMVQADFFISVHHNSVYSSAKNGTEVYYSVANEGNFNGMTSVSMAVLFENNLVDALGTKKNGTFGARNYVVVSEENSVPSVILEIGYMSNPDELARVIKPGFQKKVAKVIYKTVKQLYDKYGD